MKKSFLYCAVVWKMPIQRANRERTAVSLRKFKKFEEGEAGKDPAYVLFPGVFQQQLYKPAGKDWLIR